MYPKCEKRDKHVFDIVLKQYRIIVEKKTFIFFPCLSAVQLIW